MTQPPDISTLHSNITSVLISTTRTVSELCAEDLAFHRQLDPSIGLSLDRQNTRLLELAERLIRNAAVDKGGESVKLQAEDEDVKEVVDGQWGKIVDVVDGLLERADASLDEYTGAVKRGKAQQGQDTQLQAPATSKPATPKVNVLRSQDIIKPQLSFEQPPQNSPRGFWKPLLKSKPHAKVPLEKSIDLTTGTDEWGNQYQHHTHPYYSEIQAYEYPARVTTAADPIPPQDWATTTATLVDTIEGVHEMLAELKEASEIAVDLEHHDFRTYIGLTSLMQISTRSKDYIVDTLKPWRQELQVLNEVFADPSILKILHGSTMDMIWLQRDLGIYVVGLFDTYHASRALHYQRAGLDFLLSKFVNFQAQKKYQRADWRIRPLPDELFDYARSDTHFLLYIYDRMRNELIEGSTPENGLMKYVLEHSKQEALQHYEHPVYKEDGTGSVGWMKPLLSTPAMLSKEQFSVFRAVHAWRDRTARDEDESVPFVMPNHALFAVARNMPTDKPSLFGTLQGVSLPVRLRADELIAVVNKAKEDGKDGPELNDALGIHLGKRKRHEPDHSVGAAVKRVQLDTQKHGSPDQQKLFTTPTPDLQHVRAEESAFWGSAFSKGVWSTLAVPPASRADAQEAAVCLALPLPHLTAQVYADTNGPAVVDSNKPSGDNPASMAEHAYIRPEDRKNNTGDDGVFIVRQAGGKKRKVHGVETPQNGVNVAGADMDEDALDDYAHTGQTGHDDDSPKLSKKAMKRARKRERKAAMRHATNGANDSPSAVAGLGTDADEVKVDSIDEPFDYSTAPSVLYPHDAAAGYDRSSGRKKKKDKGFDPYQKALNAPKGLPKKQRDSSGRSKTFAS